MATILLPSPSRGAALPATDANGYRSRYELPFIRPGTGDSCDTGWTCYRVPEPTPGHGVDCDTSPSGPNPNDPSQYFVTPNGSTRWREIHNNSTHFYSAIFVCPGDYSADGQYAGDGNEIWLRQGGASASQPLYIGWWDSDYEDSSTPAYRMNRPSGTDPRQAILPRFEIHDAVSHVVFDRLVAVGRPNGGTTFAFIGSGNVEDIVFNAMYLSPEYAKQTAQKQINRGRAIGGVSNRTKKLRIQNSVLSRCGALPNRDLPAFAFNGADGFYVVNNEIFDCTDLLTGGCGVSDETGAGCDSRGLFIENNDLYFTSAYTTTLAGKPGVDESPTNPPSGSGNYLCAENLWDVKGGFAESVRDQRDWAQFVHNRGWGSKPGFAGGEACSCGSSGSYGNNAIAVWDGHTQYLLIKDNLLFNLDTSAVAFIAHSSPGGSNHVSVIGNLIANIRNNDQRLPQATGICGSQQTPVNTYAVNLADIESTHEIHLNTIVNVQGGSGNGNVAWLASNGRSDVDMSCNLVIDSAQKAGSGEPTNGWVGRNAFIGTPVYAAPQTTANYRGPLTKWSPSTTYAVGDWVTANTDSCERESDPGCFLFVAEHVQGNQTSGQTEPQWSTSAGTTTSDGNVTWRAALGPYSFWRKLQTQPESYIIARVRPAPNITAILPAFSVCSATTLGSRRGYGVNDDSTTYP